jgi:hypothetical protein
MNFKFNSKQNISESTLKDVIQNFNTKGTLFGDGKRNTIKLFDCEGKTINIKSFKIPNLLNAFIYQYFRKSKAKRSFEFATFLKLIC